MVGVVLQAFGLDDIEYGIANRTRHRIAAEGIEILHPIGKSLRDLDGCDDCSDWMPISQWLSHSDNVGNYRVVLKRPHCRTDTAEADLHFIGDADGASGSGVLVSRLKVAISENHLSAASTNRLGNERCGPAIRFGQACAIGY